MAAQEPRPEGLGPGIVALIAVDAVLVLTLVVLAVSMVLGGDDGGEDRATPGATATDLPGSPSTTPSPSPTMTEFALPSGNIACSIGQDAVRCSIASFVYAAPPLEGCTEPVGHVIELTAAGAGFACAPAPEPVGEEVPVLGYEEEATGYGFTCSSSTAGVLCRNATGAGFTLARAGFTVFD